MAIFQNRQFSNFFCENVAKIPIDLYTDLLIDGRRIGLLERLELPLSDCSLIGIQENVT